MRFRSVHKNLVRIFFLVFHYLSIFVLLDCVRWLRNWTIQQNLILSVILPWFKLHYIMYILLCSIILRLCFCLFVFARTVEYLFVFFNSIPFRWLRFIEFVLYLDHIMIYFMISNIFFCLLGGSVSSVDWKISKNVSNE